MSSDETNGLPAVFLDAALRFQCGDQRPDAGERTEAVLARHCGEIAGR